MAGSCQGNICNFLSVSNFLFYFMLSSVLIILFQLYFSNLQLFLIVLVLVNNNNIGHKSQKWM